MLVHPYYGPGNIVMDSCEACNAVWLDFGELKQVVDAPGSDRGRRDVPRKGAPQDSSGPAPRLGGVELSRDYVTGSLDLLDIFGIIFK